MSSDLSDLVENPREDLGIECKAWLDLTEKLQRAKIARHLAALANHGGGYLVLGFSDDLTPDQHRPTDVRIYNRDVFSDIVRRYLIPRFQCEVIRVAAANGEEFPIVRVPGHGSVPIAAKANGPTGRSGGPQGIRAGVYYIRKPGPESAPIIGAEEWAPLIRRCVLNDRDGLLRDFSTLMCQWRSKKGPPRRCKKGPLGGCGLVPVVHGRAPRATRRALNRLTRRRAREGPVGPRGQAWAGWSVQLAVGV